MKMNKEERIENVRKMFLTQGTCSNTFFHVLNQKFQISNAEGEIASDTLAGGIMRQGYQCGMLWGSSLGCGSEISRRYTGNPGAVALSIEASKNLVASFKKQTGTTECSDITETDWNSKISMAKYAVTGKFMTCFNLARDWANEAADTAEQSLNRSPENLPEGCKSCASETIYTMGGSEEDAVTVSGFAGGIGLSGSGCGALAAAIWYKSLIKMRTKNEKPGLNDPDIDPIVEKFQKHTNHEFECRKISNKIFNSPQEHSAYIEQGGCKNIIQLFAEFK
ncbi:MAG: C-GCAxxG-C-C family protein [Spirochaetia bacterium]|nr:C-GCAxxG-C-C family protein [Spirochaetia bacterium]